jgi:Ca2+-binding RTX toxin-like protein
VATFSVPNGTGIDSNNDSVGDGVKFGQLSLIASSGILGVPLITPTSGNVTFNDFGSVILAGTGMSFTLPGTFTGTVESLTYTKLIVPVFAIADMSVPLATVAGLLLGGGNEETILGTIFAGADQIEGSSMPDILKGYAGNDIIIGGGGADTIDGGDGTDAAGYFNSGFGVIVDLGTGTGGSSDAAGDVLISIENLGGSTFDDTLTGNAGANLLNGGGGSDILDGAAGADTLYGGNGDDTIDGGDGNDALNGGGGGIFGGIFGGIDTLNGGAGNDALNGGVGADAINGGAGVDIADYNGSADGVTVNLTTNINTGGYAEGDMLTLIENLQGSNADDTLTGDIQANLLLGRGGNDVLNGSAGWDTLDGGNGDDQLNGGADGDILRGGAGADQLAGGAGSDTATYFDSAAGVTINLQTGVNTGGTAAGDTIANDIETINGSNHDDVMTGNALGNGLIGYDGADTLSGGGNNDTLRGGSGADVLNGGTGADYFSYTAVSDSTALATDTIQDFQAGTDLISLRLIDADGNSVNGDTAFAFLGTGAFTGTAGQLRYDSGGGTTTVSADVDGNGTADIIINLTGTFALQASNFLL